MNGAPYVPRERCTDVVLWRRTVAADPALPPAAKLVAYMLYEHMTWRGDNAGGSCYPSLETLAERCGWKSKTAVIRALAKLDEAGYIDRSTGGGRGVSTRYRATLPVQKGSHIGTVYEWSSGSSDGRPMDEKGSHPDGERVTSEARKGAYMSPHHPLTTQEDLRPSRRVATDVETRDDASLQKPATNGLAPSDVPEWWIAQLEAEDITDDVKLGVRAYDIGVEEDYCCEVWERVAGDRNNQRAWAGYRQRQRAADRGDDDRCVGWCRRCHRSGFVDEHDGLCAGCHENDPYADLPDHDGYTAHGIPRCMATRKAGQRCLTGARRKRRRVWPYCREHLQEFGVPAPADEQCRYTGCTDWSRANKATCRSHDGRW